MSVEHTKAGSHRAIERGYASGELIEAGCPVPAGVPIGSWMEANPDDSPTKGAKAAPGKSGAD